MDVEQTIFIPPDFYCPITGYIMVDPVSDNGGHTFRFNISILRRLQIFSLLIANYAWLPRK